MGPSSVLMRRPVGLPARPVTVVEKKRVLSGMVAQLGLVTPDLL